jgi:hypothetical protein
MSQELVGVDVEEYTTVELRREIPGHLLRCVEDMIDYYLVSKGFPEVASGAERLRRVVL